jgi:hypothetical protein
VSNNFVQVPPNSTGVKLQTFENTISGNAVDAEAVVIVDTTGTAIPTSNTTVGGAVPTDTTTIGGSDYGGSPVSHPLKIDSNGAIAIGSSVALTVTQTTASNLNAEVVGAGTAGSPSGGVVSVQGVASGTVVPVSGTLTAVTTITNPVTVVGDAANGAVVAGNPVLVAGSDGTDARTLSTDAHGQLDILNGTVAETTAAWTSGTSQNTALTVNTAGYATVVVTLNGVGTLSGQVWFEASDTTAFTTAYNLPGGRLSQGANNPTYNPDYNYNYNFTSSTTVVFILNCAGWAAVRVRLSTAITGGGTLNVGMTLSASAGNYVNLMNAGLAVQSANGGSNQADNQLNATVFPDVNFNNYPLWVGGANYGGAFSGTANTALQGWSKARTPTVFKTVSVSASTTGNSAVWTPGSGNKFRLLGFQITAQGLNATATGLVTVSFQDSSTGITFGTYDVDVPALANVVSGVSNISGGFVSLGAFGILSAAANNVLNFNISAAGTGTAGTYRVNVCGTEE